MSIKSLKIVIFDGSFSTTAFINRLIKGLAARHEVYVLGFNVELPEKIEGVHYVPLGSNQIKFRFVFTSLNYAIRSGSLKNVSTTFQLLLNGERIKLQQQNLCFALKMIQPDIIHMQWPSLISWFENVLSTQEFPVILSQRGTQNNVRPFIEDSDFTYLKEWYPKINGFHSVSRAIAENGNKIHSDKQKIDRLIYTGIPFEDLNFVQHYHINKTLKLLSVGREHWIKGYDYALHTCKILKKVGMDFHYTIIGGAGAEELQFLIADLQLEKYVSLIDRMPQAEVFNRMKESSLLLLPSVEEGIPNVVVEAMALGLPVLSTNCGGVEELIMNDVEGWLVPIRDPEAMAEGVVAFSNLSLQKIEKVRRAARKKVEMQHSEEEMIRGMEGLYYEVISRRGRGV